MEPRRGPQTFAFDRSIAHDRFLAEGRLALVLKPRVPLAGLSIIEALMVDEVVRLIAATPSARAKGAIEIRTIMAINGFKVDG